MIDFYLLTFPIFLLWKKEHESFFDKNRTHVFRTTSRCAGYLLDHSGDDRKIKADINPSIGFEMHTNYQRLIASTCNGL